MRKRPSKSRLLRIIARSRVSRNMKELARAGVREFYSGRLKPVQGVWGSRRERCACLVGAAMIARNGDPSGSALDAFGVKRAGDLVIGFDDYGHGAPARGSNFWNKSAYRLGRAIARELFEER